MQQRALPFAALAAAQAIVAAAALLPPVPPDTAPARGLLNVLSPDVGLLSNTVLAMGGNTNPTGLTPDLQLLLRGDHPWAESARGLVNTRNNPASPYYGWDFDVVEWPAQIWLPVFGNWAYEPAQQVGQRNFATALDAVLPTLAAGEQITALGYSSSANVMVRQMRALQSQTGRPADGQLSFILVGNPNRPNGGVLQRFAGLYIPVVDVPMDGAMPADVPYRTTDISWEYDPVSDFPLYPLNLLAVLNSLIAGITLHSDYINADIEGRRALPDTTVGAITYITLESPGLPLLTPLRQAGIPEPLLDLVEPALKVVIDWAYDRSIGPGTPTTARLVPVLPPTATGDLADALAKGLGDFTAAVTPARPRPGTTGGASFRPAREARPGRHRATRVPAGSRYSASSGRSVSVPPPPESSPASESRTLTSMP